MFPLSLSLFLSLSLSLALSRSLSLTGLLMQLGLFGWSGLGEGVVERGEDEYCAVLMTEQAYALIGSL